MNPTKRTRAWIYLVSAVGAPVVAYLNARGVIGDLEVALWAAETTVVHGLAAINVPTSAPDRRPVRPRERGQHEA